METVDQAWLDNLLGPFQPVGTESLHIETANQAWTNNSELNEPMRGREGFSAVETANQGFTCDSQGTASLSDQRRPLDLGIPKEHMDIETNTMGDTLKPNQSIGIEPLQWRVALCAKKTCY